jgi:hypothetical protein
MKYVNYVVDCVMWAVIAYCVVSCVVASCITAYYMVTEVVWW